MLVDRKETTADADASKREVNMDRSERLLGAYSTYTSVVGVDRYCVEAAGVYRVIQIANKKPYAAISASRSQYSPEENNKRAASLLSDIKSTGLYSYEMIGGYEETTDDGEKVQVVENSFFVPYDERRPLAQFIRLFQELTSKYGQESFLLGLPAEYDYEHSIVGPIDLAAGQHYFVNKFGKGTSVGTKATMQTFDKFGSLAIDPKKNRILEWVTVGTTAPTSVSGRILMEKMGLAWSVPKSPRPELLTALKKVIK